MKLNTNTYKAFFFDFDGVIVDSINIKTQAFGELFQKYGKDIAGKVMRYHRNNGGVSRYEKFKYYYTQLLNKKINPDIMRRLDRQYSRLVVKKVIEAPFIPGVMSYIRALNKKNKPCFIISGTPQKEMRTIAARKKIGLLFKNIVGSPQDKTKNLKSLLRRYTITPQDSLYFGDAKSDYAAAKANRVPFVAIVNGKSRELKYKTNTMKIRNFLHVDNGRYSK